MAVNFVSRKIIFWWNTMVANLFQGNELQYYSNLSDLLYLMYARVFVFVDAGFWQRCEHAIEVHAHAMCSVKSHSASQNIVGIYVSQQFSLTF